MKRIGCVWKWLWPDLKCYPDIFLERLRKAIENLRQDSRSLGQCLNPGPPEYEAGVLTTKLRHSVLDILYLAMISAVFYS
jgi:hypothetical protein